MCVNCAPFAFCEDLPTVEQDARRKWDSNWKSESVGKTESFRDKFCGVRNSALSARLTHLAAVAEVRMAVLFRSILEPGDAGRPLGYVKRREGGVGLEGGGDGRGREEGRGRRVGVP